MTQPRIRYAHREDCDGVWPLARELATSYEVERGAYEAAFARVLADENAVVLVAEDVDQVVVGYLLGQRHHTFHANGIALWIEEIMVSAEHRGHGVGRSLMTEAERWGRTTGAAYVALATRRAADFYAALGYEASATYFKRSL